MKELTGTALNFFWNQDDEGMLTPQAEMILVVSEPEYSLVEKKVHSKRVCTTLRIGMSHRSVLQLIKNLLAVDKEMTVMERATLGLCLKNQSPDVPATETKAEVAP